MIDSTSLSLLAVNALFWGSLFLLYKYINSSPARDAAARRAASCLTNVFLLAVASLILVGGGVAVREWFAHNVLWAALGDTVGLRQSSASSGGQGVVLLAKDLAALAERDRLLVAKDDLGVAEMIASGRLAAVAGGTHARVIDRLGVHGYQVRILGGSLMGQAGWIGRPELTPLNQQ